MMKKNILLSILLAFYSTSLHANPPQTCTVPSLVTLASEYAAKTIAIYKQEELNNLPAEVIETIAAQDAVTQEIGPIKNKLFPIDITLNLQHCDASTAFAHVSSAKIVPPILNYGFPKWSSLAIHPEKKNFAIASWNHIAIFYSSNDNPNQDRRWDIIPLRKSHSSKRVNPTAISYDATGNYLLSFKEYPHRKTLYIWDLAKKRTCRTYKNFHLKTQLAPDSMKGHVRFAKEPIDLKQANIMPTKELIAKCSPHIQKVMVQYAALQKKLRSTHFPNNELSEQVKFFLSSIQPDADIKEKKLAQQIKNKYYKIKRSQKAGYCRTRLQK